MTQSKAILEKKQNIHACPIPSDCPAAPTVVIQLIMKMRKDGVQKRYWGKKEEGQKGVGGKAQVQSLLLPERGRNIVEKQGVMAGDCKRETDEEDREKQQEGGSDE